MTPPYSGANDAVPRGKSYAIAMGMATTLRANTFLQRLVGAAALDAAIYEEVEADPHATGQAMLLVVLSSLGMGIGARGLGGGPSTIAVFGVIALVSWAAWALLMFEVGTRIMPGRRTHADPYELLRTLGFAATPGCAAVLGAVPEASVMVFACTWAWMLAAMVVAVRQALDYESTGRAVAVCTLGFVLALFLMVVLGFGVTNVVLAIALSPVQGRLAKRLGATRTVGQLVVFPASFLAVRFAPKRLYSVLTFALGIAMILGGFAPAFWALFATQVLFSGPYYTGGISALVKQ